MAPVYADHPFALIPTPLFQGKEESGSFQPDMYERVASEMACVHNMILRGINSIYLQAPYVKPADVPAFVQYCIQWYRLLDVHHTTEETSFFTDIEKMTGEKGCMDANVEQHHAFADGVAAFKGYLYRCAEDQQQFDGRKVVEMIDLFGSVLVQHLTDEIPTLIALGRFGDDKMSGLEAKFAKEGEENMKSLGLVSGLPWCFVNHDITYEGGLWSSWPPAPAPVKFLCKNVIHWVHMSWWKFGSCDRAGRLRPLYAVPEEGGKLKNVVSAETTP
ncbi:hemerythrin HHE cation binding domain-containing protein [Plectosphaerella plurivora]|uniref:Hemerythrin HHE cation binding domain-containing protein n=1 Tax=Plectosphaerella plurivora TaxID=936078 RepID=A0A9P9A6B7_9PEZI|nr:hemerythrin HHE cation binding domain-containing protein [Plectosphaerella plurivora]